MLIIETICHYSHLACGRIKLSKSIIESTAYFNITKKIDEFGKNVQKLCIDFLKQKGKSEDIINAFIELGTKIRVKRTSTTSISKHY